MQTILGKHWHHLPAAEVLELLDSNDERGLDVFEVQHRRQRFGPNALTPRRGKSPLTRFLLQFNNPLIYILLAAAVITAVLKDMMDAIIIFLVVLINAVIGYLQEARAEKAMEALAQRMSSEATVVRAGQTQRIAAVELVPGDIVVLAAGDRVPADLRLLRARDLQMDESALTGESLPVRRSRHPPADAGIGDRRNMAYSSSLVTSGQGRVSSSPLATIRKSAASRSSSPRPPIWRPRSPQDRPVRPRAALCDPGPGCGHHARGSVAWRAAD